jgi:hypothetical protein
MSTLALNFSDEIEVVAEAQAARRGMRVEDYLATIAAERVRALAEAERWFAERAGDVTPEEGLEILARAGHDNPPEPGDELPPDLAEKLARWRLSDPA